MCLFSAPKIEKLEPIPAGPTRDNPESVRMQEEQKRKLRLRKGVGSTQLSGPLGDSGYGSKISKAVVLGGT